MISKQQIDLFNTGSYEYMRDFMRCYL